MTQELRPKPAPYHLQVLAEIKRLCGPPPVLSTENVKAYDTMMLRLIESLSPRDFMEGLLIKHLADCTWEIIRYTRHKTLLMERKHRQLLDSRAQHIKAAAQDKQAQARKFAEERKDCKPQADAMHATLKEIEAIMLQSPTDLDHADALERGIEYAERLDKLLNAATARRDDVLQQWERYRDARRSFGIATITHYEAGHPGRGVDKELEAIPAHDVSDELLKQVEAPPASSNSEVKQVETPPASSDT
jgi:hypothetical protein